MDFKYFKLEEFDCPCCGENKIALELVQRADKARHIAGIPFVVTSGFRCEKHNEEINGNPKSKHKLGLAMDILCKSDNDRFRIIKGLLDAGFMRIGIGEDFVHADIMYTDNPVIFRY